MRPVIFLHHQSRGYLGVISSHTSKLSWPKIVIAHKPPARGALDTGKRGDLELRSSRVGLSRMDLLTNAIESIRTGVEDYEEGSHGRLLASVRSIHAGILLLYKEALSRLSPAGSNEVPREDENRAEERRSRQR